MSFAYYFTKSLRYSRAVASRRKTIHSWTATRHKTRLHLSLPLLLLHRRLVRPPTALRCPNFNGLDVDDPRALIEISWRGLILEPWDSDASFAENGSIMHILIVASRAATLVKHGIVLEGQAQYGLCNLLFHVSYCLLVCKAWNAYLVMLNLYSVKKQCFFGAHFSTS
jgi:hypothetical protein